MTRRASLTLPLLLVLLGAPHARASERPDGAGPGGTSADALRIARASRERFHIGPLAVTDEGVRADLLHRGAPVARLRIDPRTGGFLPEREEEDGDDEEEGGTAGRVDPARLQAAAARALAGLSVGGWAWPAEHGRAWVIPLVYRGRIVARLVVEPRTGRLLACDDD